LHGLLARVRDLGLPLVALRRIDPSDRTQQQASVARFDAASSPSMRTPPEENH
jgi:hypothetical protein